MRSVQIRSFFYSVFSRIRTECGDLLCKSPHSVQIRENKDQEKLRIWTIYAQCYCKKILAESLVNNCDGVHSEKTEDCRIVCRRSGVSIVNFERISHLILVFLLLTLNS